MMKLQHKALHFCEEFSDLVLFDHTRHSIIVNIEKKFLRVVKHELERLGYILTFVTGFKQNTTLTCGFIKHDSIIH